MAQKKSLPPQSPALLTISSEEFKKNITERISIGQELFFRPVTVSLEFDILQSDYSIWDDYNKEYLKQVFNVSDNEYRISYSDAGYSYLGQLGEVANNPHLTLKNLVNNKLSNLKSLLAKSDLIKLEIKPNGLVGLSNISITPKTHVFIVHGHDDTAKVKVARFIERLGFLPIILHEQASSGKTIIEKIESYSNVGFGIVLYTQCDIGALKDHEHDLKPRARQNVVFEHGFLIGKIGRNNVCALVKNEVETPNDIAGVVFVKMDDDEAWHVKIAKELKVSGYDVDMNKL